MNNEPDDLLPQWSPQSLPSQGRPRGLLDELIEDGVLVKELVGPGHTYRVQTKIHCDTSACLFRSAVSCDGEETTEPPWAPIFRNLAQEMAGRENDPEGRREVARRALKVHLSLCTRVGRVLETQGHLGKPIDWGLRTLQVGGPILGLLLAAGLGWYYWSRSHPVMQPQENAVEAPSEAEADGADAKPAMVSAGPVDAQSGIPAPVPAPPVNEPSTLETSPNLTPAPPPDHRARQLQSHPPPTATPKPLAPVEPRREPPPLRQEPESKSRWPVTADISPTDHSTVRLKTGDQVYLADNIRLVEVPPEYRGLRCITTRGSEGDTKQGIVLDLTAPARVFVAFDQQVKRRPDWLSAFTQTGDILSAVDPDKADGRFTYVVFERDFPAGTVALGANTASSFLGRKARVLTHRDTLMYLVCVPEVETDGSSGSVQSQER